jgi:hypothetical protein
MNTSKKQTENLAKTDNKSKPLLSSQLLKFRAFSNETKKMMDWDFIKSVNNLTKLISLTHVDVSEFTGLHDKIGKEIYEGDILCNYRLDGTYKMYKIFRRKGGFVFNTHQDDFKKPIDQILFTESCSDMQNAGFLETCEIEGNIWTYVW